MKPDIIIPFVFFNIFATIIILSLVFSRKKGRMEAGKLAEIAAGVNGKLKSSLFMSPSVEVDYKGSRMTIQYFREEKNENVRPHLDVSLFKKPPFRLSLTQETSVPQILKKVGLVREMVINVPDFDNKFLIRTSDKMKCLMYLSDYRKREIIENLYSGGWQVIFERDRIKFKSSFIADLAPAGEKKIPRPTGVWGMKQIFTEGLKAANSMSVLDAVTPEYLSGILEKLHRLGEGWA